MPMNAEDWSDLGLVFRAGAERARGWICNSAMQIHAEVLDAQADQCMEIARDREGNPPVTHIHYHHHDTGRKLHRHVHDHAAGETFHEGHYHEPERPLFPGSRT